MLFQGLLQALLLLLLLLLTRSGCRMAVLHLLPLLQCLHPPVGQAQAHEVRQVRAQAQQLAQQPYAGARVQGEVAQVLQA